MQDKQPNAGDARAAHDAPIEAISADHLADVLRRAGYRVTAAEQNGAVQLMSASQGVGFAVRFGNPAAALAPQGADAQLAALCTSTTRCRACCRCRANCRPSRRGLEPDQRFARLASHGQFLALEMDVVVAGGVSERYLRSTIELGSPDPGIPAAPAQPSRDGRAGSGGTRGGRRPGRRLAGGLTTVAVEATAK